MFLVCLHSLFFSAASATLVGLGGLKPPKPSSSLGGLPLSQLKLRIFREYGPRVRVDDLDTPPGELVTRAPFHVTPRGSSVFFHCLSMGRRQHRRLCACSTSCTLARGAGLGQTAVKSEPAF